MEQEVYLFVNLCFGGFTELNRSTNSCSSFIFIKYNIELFLQIDKMIYMGKVDSLFLPEKLHVIENKSSSWEL